MCPPATTKLRTKRMKKTATLHLAFHDPAISLAQLYLCSRTPSNKHERFFRHVAHHVSSRATPPSVNLLRRETLSPQLLEGLLGLLQIPQPHTAQDVPRLGELDLAVLDHLPAVAPRVVEVQAPAGYYLHARLPQSLSHGPLVVHHDPEVAVLVGRLCATFGEC